MSSTLIFSESPLNTGTMTCPLESVLVGCHENLHAILHHRGFYRDWIRTPCHNPSPAQPYSMEVFVQVYSTRNFTPRKICFPQSKLVCLKCDAYKCGHAVHRLTSYNAFTLAHGWTRCCHRPTKWSEVTPL